MDLVIFHFAQEKAEKSLRQTLDRAISVMIFFMSARQYEVSSIYFPPESIAIF